MTSKPEMRASARALRKRLVHQVPDAARRLAAFADDLPQGGTVALYQSAGSELDVGPLARALAARGLSLCLPVVAVEAAPLVFRSWHPGDPLEADQAGMAAPASRAPEVTPDLILTPLLAFDVFGGRLGQGGGYYDRTFAILPDAIRIGVAYAAQQLDRVPMEPHDIGLHGVLTETGYTPARKG